MHEPTGGPIIPTNIIPTESSKCDPDTVYFQNSIFPIFISNCAFSGCHDAVTHEEDINLASYQAMINSHVVNAGSSSKSKLYKVITETNPEDRMPPDPYDPLTTEQKDMIRKWIEQGAKYNECRDECDTVNVTFSKTITGIINTNCVGCHRKSNPSGNVILENYTDISSLGKDGRLYGAVANLAGYIPMPYQSYKLEDCKITQIKKWIDDGTPNN
ncbi:c-type cytochrome domain-containing protein [Bacteroidota bacterium]